MKIIGITGAAGSGKDTAASFFERRGYQKISLADPMKRFCRELFGFTDEELWGASKHREKSRRGVTARHVLQQMGTEWGRRLDPDVWIDYLVESCRRISTGGKTYTAEHGLSSNLDPIRFRPPKGFVVADIRFRNEARKIRAEGGAIILLRGSYAPLSGSASAHVSEQTTWAPDEVDAALGPFALKDDLFQTLETVSRALTL